jgi:anti-sigma factor RsiW
MTELSDELLVPYVDGQLARKQTRAVDKVLDQDDVIARRVDALRHAHNRLEAAFEAILAGEEADISAKSRPEHAGIWIEWRIAKFVLAVIGIVAAASLAVAGYGWPLALPELWRAPQAKTEVQQAKSVAPDWREETVRAHALLSRASLEVGLESQGNEDFITFQLAEAIGASLKLPDLRPQGFRFIRAQLLRSGETPLAQLLYLAPAGPPLALYAQKGEGGGAPAFKSYGAIGSVAWAEDGIAYLLAGEEEEAVLMRLAEKIRNEPQPPLPSPPAEATGGTAQAVVPDSPSYSPLPYPLGEP